MALLELLPHQIFLAQRLRELATRLQWPSNRYFIRQRLLTADQRAEIDGNPSAGLDEVFAWAKGQAVSMPEAVIDLAAEVELISTKERKHLLDDIHSELGGSDADFSSSSRDRHRGNRKDTRRFVQATLSGSHTHTTKNGVSVNISQRDGKFIARGSYRGWRFGLTLGSTEAEAESELRNILVAIENGSFMQPSEARRLPMSEKSVPRLSVQQLCNRFIGDVRARNGKNTADSYLSRLQPLIAFSATTDATRRWPYGIAWTEISWSLFARRCTRGPPRRTGTPGRRPRQQARRRYLTSWTVAERCSIWRLNRKLVGFGWDLPIHSPRISLERSPAKIPYGVIRYPWTFALR